ncbi:unnamed protein product [Phaedon cochleariae]|uniref:Uncharacterized protein n=1 Tax=Phaedon cochleariae TaxID=80249 RepID=A0A9N9X5Q4_PHACE|nr:unnamed protein product [Phaedon cochleariae]
MWNKVSNLCHIVNSDGVPLLVNLKLQSSSKLFPAGERILAGDGSEEVELLGCQEAISDPRAVSDQRAIFEQSAISDQRVIFDQSAISDHRTIYDQRAIFNERAISDQRAVLEQSAVFDQDDISDPSVFLEGSDRVEYMAVLAAVPAPKDAARFVSIGSAENAG